MNVTFRESLGIEGRSPSISKTANGPARGTSRRFLLVTVLLLGAGIRLGAAEPLATPKEMADAVADVWGEAAIRQPGGPNYDFFKDLLPPVRYVNTDFRHYPIVLSAPAGAVKARWISNGSAINARANKKPMWREVGFPVHFRVGDPDEPFGDDLDRLDGPRYAEGYLPIVRAAYTQRKTIYEQEAFVPVSGPLSARGAVLVRFSARQTAGIVTARLDHDGPLRADKNAISDAKGQALILHDGGWRWDGERKELKVNLGVSRSAVLAVPTQPLPSPWPDVSAEFYEKEHRSCAQGWQAILDRGTTLDIPEPVVQNAWRALVVGQYLIAVGERMNYSAGNAYDHLYEAECGDAVRSLLLLGQESARGMIGPLLDFDRRATRFHVAGHKLQLLAHYYWLTRDKAYLRDKEGVWKPVVEFIVSSRETKNGLLPKDNYAGDVSQQVHSLSSNAACWRGLRDMAAGLDDRERTAQALAFRKAIHEAVQKSERREAKPPFIPIALLGDEPAHHPLTATRQGSYYDLMAPYVLGSEVFGPGSEREGWMIDYLRRHGGLAMGMIRSMPHQGEFDKQPGNNALYGLRYILTLLRRDDREHALASFYGHLAQGLTRDTFIGAEATRFFHGDRRGRSMYLPPNSASNALFLTTLRYLLVQDWDLDDDGKPETLRLLYGVPGRWLRDGATLKVERAPTAFGVVSLTTESRLARGELLVTIAPPPRPAKLLVRPTLPPGWKITGAKVGNDELKLSADGAADVTSRSQRITIRYRVEPR